MEGFEVTPAQASRGRVVADRELPMLAAYWLTEGYDSALLRELAGLTRRDATPARRDDLADLLRVQLRSLRESDVPPLV